MKGAEYEYERLANLVFVVEYTAPLHSIVSELLSLQDVVLVGACLPHTSTVNSESVISNCHYTLCKSIICSDLKACMTLMATYGD